MIDADAIQKGFREVQTHITDFLVEADGQPFREDKWDYDKGPGGGITRVWEHSTLLEKGGVNFSAIHGASLPASAATQFKIPEGTPFLATGVSMVLHPWNPHIPTVHMNIRYFEAGERWWFGGGIDMTPYYPVKAQVIEYHQALKAICDESGEPYALHKKQCDEYFFLTHRDEMRGVGGTFFDHLQDDKEKHYAYCKNLGLAFPNLYRPFVEANRDRRHTDAEREFQLYRRGRYVEFNLVYDRGTLFGLQSKGRTESILMSLPATAHWRYDWHPEPGTPEAELTDFFLKPQDWADMSE
ncbi:MAG: oxygen-dependent coproporphyrinogen oxidase [Candidatus Hydrogenedentes bacterium]|nr:oxygen-dependent coproporphyrinogen oxidase [Candidatus Hydrogenedentota bacterium]